MLENGLVRAVVDGRGLLTSVVDLASGREAIAPGAAGNLLQLHPDVPNEWDAWDVDRHYTRHVTDLVDVDVARAGAGRRRGRPPYGSNAASGGPRSPRWCRWHPGARRVDVDTEVDWQEVETFLKAAFPLDVRADRSSSEIQFGYVQRATNTNTSWDVARFEICAHRYLHVGEPGYGLAVVNDSTYGHDVACTVRPDGGTTTTVRLSLLRAPRFPDPETDLGRHRLRYALVVGADLLDATREGHWLNLPVRTVARRHRVDAAGVRGPRRHRGLGREAGRRRRRGPRRRRGRPGLRGAGARAAAGSAWVPGGLGHGDRPARAAPGRRGSRPRRPAGSS